MRLREDRHVEDQLTSRVQSRYAPRMPSQNMAIAIGSGLLGFGMYLWQLTVPGIVSFYDSGVYFAASIHFVSGVLPYKDFTFVRSARDLVAYEPGGALRESIRKSRRICSRTDYHLSRDGSQRRTPSLAGSPSRADGHGHRWSWSCTSSRCALSQFVSQTGSVLRLLSSAQFIDDRFERTATRSTFNTFARHRGAPVWSGRPSQALGFLPVPSSRHLPGAALSKPSVSVHWRSGRRLHHSFSPVFRLSVEEFCVPKFSPSNFSRRSIR